MGDMNDREALNELLELDRETLEKMSSKPFKPCCLDVILSMHAPHLYSEEELAEIKNFYEELHHQQQQQQPSPQDEDAAAAVVPEKTEEDNNNNNMLVATAERCPNNSDQDLPERIIEDDDNNNNNNTMTTVTAAESEEEQVLIHPAPAVTQKPRSKKKNIKTTGKKKCHQKEVGVIKNPVVENKKPRDTINMTLNINAATPSSQHSSPTTSPSVPSSSILSPPPDDHTSPISSSANLSPPPDDHTTPPASSPSNDNNNNNNSESPAELPVRFKNKIRELNGTDLVFIMHKRLFQTDVEENNDRLSMPGGQIKCEFLTEAEKAALQATYRKKSKIHFFGVEVAVLDPCLREFTLKLKKWDMTSSCTYNLACDWYKGVVKSNDLRPNDQLDIWSFRAQGKRYFLLNKL